MKKVLFMLLILAGSVFAQSEDIVVWGSWTHRTDSATVTLYNSDTSAKLSSKI